MYNVIMATYNGEKYVVEQLDSIVNQTILPRSIIIRDDCSTDNTCSIIREYIKNYRGSVRFNIIEPSQNLGYVKNFDVLSRAADAEIVFFCDQDDVWVKNKAEIILNKFNENASLNLIFSDAELVNDKLEEIGLLWNCIGFNFDKDRITLARLHKKSVVTGATMACRRAFLHTLVPFPEDVPHDLWLSACSTFQGSIGICKEPLIKYRQHSNNQIGVRESNFLQKILTPFKSNKIKFRVQHYKNNYQINEAMASFIPNYRDSTEHKEIMMFLTFVGRIYQIDFYKHDNKYSHFDTIKAYVKYNDKKHILFNLIDFFWVHIAGFKQGGGK
ncbi:UDP-Glc:alpha-D-GlcNAc-diphosphoundecaprenol beta-1,3-glucosyltransferase WfgD [compost metagenome]|uniref:Glycosyltransferase family 2 protein n=1 Tax=Silvania hatchlandensis TaxID=2926469 RepID=A0A9J6Q342_9ENTR|nr:glycosyltransferase family 2 protein [Silvania hatchlandensis]MCU6664555.1 glycosyltransferase family 2 protein [Silvania hatchlandensis]